MARKILIKNGIVVDGSGARGHQADVLIVGDTIDAVGQKLPPAADLTLDAQGLVVAPGFIDTHSHADGGLLDTPDAETQIRQGITTSCVGQDGSSHFPLTDWMGQVAAKHAAINIASFIGHGTMRSQVLGKDYKRKATPEEVQKMCAILDAEMKSGALGLSSGLEYDPGTYSDTEELIQLARVAGRYRGIYISHVRDEEEKALQSFAELVRISSEGHLPAQISHIKLASSGSWGRTREVFQMMDAARSQGQDITADVYPYTYWQSTIIVLIPTRDWDNRSLWETGLKQIGGPQNVLLSSYEPDPTWEGKTIAEIAARTGKDAVTVIQEIVQKTHGPTPARESVVVTAMQERDLRAFIAHPRIMFCTDGGLHGTHPRGAGSYPRVLGKYVREEHVLSLEFAILKMTSLPAWRMGFRDRGAIARGKKADLVLFDPKTVHDTATTKNPRAAPIGIPHVLVNGVPVLMNGMMTGERPGQVLRRG